MCRFWLHCIQRSGWYKVFGSAVQILENRKEDQMAKEKKNLSGRSKAKIRFKAAAGNPQENLGTEPDTPTLLVKK